MPPGLDVIYQYQNHYFLYSIHNRLVYHWKHPCFAGVQMRNSDWEICLKGFFFLLVQSSCVQVSQPCTEGSKHHHQEAIEKISESGEKWGHSNSQEKKWRRVPSQGVGHKNTSRRLTVNCSSTLRTLVLSKGTFGYTEIQVSWYSKTRIFRVPVVLSRKQTWARFHLSGPGQVM